MHCSPRGVLEGRDEAPPATRHVAKRFAGLVSTADCRIVTAPGLLDRRHPPGICVRTTCPPPEPMISDPQRCARPSRRRSIGPTLAWAFNRYQPRAVS